MVLGYAPPYYLRLRIYARQIDRFYRKLRELDPVYDNCPVRCIAPEADRVNGCPDCSYTILFEKFKKNYERLLRKELARIYQDAGLSVLDAKEQADRDAGDGWSFDSLSEDYRILSETEAIAGTETSERPGLVSPNWNIRIKTAIDIIREERYKVRREVENERRLEREAKERAKARQT